MPLAVTVVEDDHDLRAMLVRGLREAGYTVSSQASGAAALADVTAQPPAAVVMDIGLPDADGRDVCQALRARGIDVPVLFLTARDALTDRLSGFHSGGDDYLSKPFDFSELLVRVAALVRRGVHHAPAPVGLVLDPSVHQAHHGERSVQLTPTEFRLLAALAAHSGKLMRRAQLLSAAWPDGAIVHDNTLDSYVRRLRAKLVALDISEALSTVYGVGYRLDAPGPGDAEV